MNRNTSPRRKVVTPVRTKSVSPLHNNPAFSKSNPSPIKSINSTSKKNASKQSNTQIISKMKKNRERLCNTLDTYTLLIRANHPIRCLEHNSNISIYCQTQQKLLCSNCIFNKIQHKYHKVVPVDKVHEKLDRDIELMKRQIQRQVEGIDQIYKRIYANYQQEQIQAQKIMGIITNQYETAKIMLDQCAKNSRYTVLKELQTVKLKHQTILSELKFLKDIYKDQCESNISSDKYSNNNQNLKVYEHMMCSSIVNQGKFFGNKWKPPIQHMKKIQKQQLGKLGKLLELMDKFLNLERKIISGKV